MTTMQEYGEQVREAAAKVCTGWQTTVAAMIAEDIRAMPLPAQAQADELAELRARLAAAEQAARERGEALTAYANLQHRIPYGEWMDMKKRIDAWIAAGMPPGELGEMPEWAKEPKP